MRQYLSIIVLFMAISRSAIAAGEVCSNLQDCIILTEKVEKKIPQLVDSNLSDFLKNRDGKIITSLTQKEASDACEQMGMRLPTAREAILDAVKFGGVVLLEVKDFDTGKIPTGFKKDEFHWREIKEADGSIDEFYFSSKKYKRPSGDLGNYSIWTSSVNPEDVTLPIIFVGELGKAYFSYINYRNDIHAVRCAHSRYDKALIF